MRVCKNEQLYTISQQEVLRTERILKGGLDSDIDSEDEASDASDDEQPGGPSRVPCRTRTGRTATRIRLRDIAAMLFAIADVMILFNSAVNPFVYALLNQQFRDKMKGMLCCTGSSTSVVHPMPEPLGMELAVRIVQPTNTAGQCSTK
ncbi:hypothetical protein ACROYT_G038837 [Oculina patagonica]